MGISADEKRAPFTERQAAFSAAHDSYKRVRRSSSRQHYLYDEAVHRLSWRLALVIALTVIGASAGFAVTTTQPSRYESELTFYVALTPEVGLDIANSGNFVEQRSRSYVALVETEEFERLVDGDADSSLTLSADYRSGTALIDVTVSGSDESRVEAAADNLLEELPRSVVELDASESDAVPPLQLRPLGRPTAPSDTKSTLQPLLMGGAAGLLIGIAFMVVMTRRSSGRHFPPQDASASPLSAQTESTEPDAAVSRG